MSGPKNNQPNNIFNNIFVSSKSDDYNKQSIQPQRTRAVSSKSNDSGKQSIQAQRTRAVSSSTSNPTLQPQKTRAVSGPKNNQPNNIFNNIFGFGNNNNNDTKVNNEDSTKAKPTAVLEEEFKAIPKRQETSTAKISKSFSVTKAIKTTPPPTALGKTFSVSKANKIKNPFFSLKNNNEKNSSNSNGGQNKKNEVKSDGIPLLTDWKQNKDGSITGKISNSSVIESGLTIVTTPVKKGAKKGIITTSSGSKYRLM